MFRVTRVLRVGDFIDDLTGDQHRHDDGFTRASGHLGTEPRELAAVRRDVDADFLRCRRFGEPDQRLHRFQLAEEGVAVRLTITQQGEGDVFATAELHQ